MSTPEDPDVLVAATHRAWIADLLSAGSPVPVVHDHGFDAPVLPAGMRAAWWTPTEHAARLLRAGQAMTLSAPGPRWLSAVPAAMTGRDIWSGTLLELRSGPRRGYAKVAEAKIPSVPAAWFDDTSAFVRALEHVAAPPGTVVQVASTRLDLAAEYRCFVLDGDVLDVACYARGEHIWDGRDAWTTVVPDAGALSFATDVAAHMSSRSPRAYVLDVAQCADGSWVVIEANPAWSSSPYGARATAVARVVLAAGADDEAFAWSPDPWLVQYAARRPVLRASTPAWPVPASRTATSP